MSKRTLDETLALIDANDTAYVGELHQLYRERRALRNIVLGARHRVKNMREQFGDNTDSHTQGALYQAEHDLEVIEYVVSMYEVEIEDEQEAK